MGDLVRLDIGRVAHLEINNPPIISSPTTSWRTLMPPSPRSRAPSPVMYARWSSRGAASGPFRQAQTSRVLSRTPAPPAGPISRARRRSSRVWRPAHANDCGDRSERARWRAGDRSRLRHPSGIGTCQPRAAGSPARRHAWRRRNAAASARRRRGPRQGDDLTGRILDAHEAERIGLVSRVVPAGRARAVADEIAAEIAERGPIAVREAKRLIDRSVDLDIEAGIAAEIDASERVFNSEDMLEGAKAFFEKRQPRYRGQ